MIGHVIMEIEHAEMVAALQFYLNHSVFSSDGELRKYHRARVIEVRQRGRGNFVVEFDGLLNPETHQARTEP